MYQVNSKFLSATNGKTTQYLAVDEVTAGDNVEYAEYPLPLYT